MDSSDSVNSEFSELSSLVQEFSQKSESISQKMQADIESLQQELQDQKSELESQLHSLPKSINEDHLDAFIEKPYTLVPKSENEMWIIVPRFIPFTVGWLEKQTNSYNHFIVNKYVNWIEEVPDEISKDIGIESTFTKAEVDGNIVSFGSQKERDKAWDVMGGREGGLYKRTDNTDIQIKSGHEFDVIAELIEHGNLPFKPTQITSDDLRNEPSNVSLRSYQERAWNKLQDTGMIGVYWPPGAGKTFLGLYAGERIRGKKLVVVPQNTLKEQWNNRINEFCEHPEEWEVQTYQYLSRGSNIQEYTDTDLAFTIIDECHHIPSSTYSKIATIDTKYRLGLSATPYREEDGTTKYIFALTGFPVGLNWEELQDQGITTYPDVSVLLHRTQHQKSQTVQEFVESKPGKIVVFCDSIDKGKELSMKLDVPFIYGDTTDRIEKFRNNRIVITSRVGDEGLSIDSIDTVIEYDFHGRSRRQELQRAGRVMHNSDSVGNHYILMTDDEYSKYSDRLLSLEQKGFKITKIRKD